jgi:hypothetical protein
MGIQQISDTSVTAITHEVLPKFGLAYLVDDCDRTWAITRSTKGPGLDGMQPGQRCQLTLDRQSAFTVVREYQLLS